MLPNTASIPAAQNLAGCHTEAVLQGGKAVLQSHVAALETRLGEKLHLRHTDWFLIFLTNDATETAPATYLKLGCGLKITLKGKKSSFKLTGCHQNFEIKVYSCILTKNSIFSKCLSIHFSPSWFISNNSSTICTCLSSFLLLRFCVYRLLHSCIPPSWAGDNTISLLTCP